LESFLQKATEEAKIVIEFLEIPFVVFGLTAQLPFKLCRLNLPCLKVSMDNPFKITG
jgi:hypothetical protein